MDSTAAQAAAQAALTAALKEALSCLVLGTVFSTWCVVLYIALTSLILTPSRCSVYGVSILQVYIYLKKCREDATHIAMRSFVSSAAYM